ncbi:MAG TPA: TolC family protein [Spirochaetota bacterium]|nr:TolC family protein [Spirochaetota bacterium]
MMKKVNNVFRINKITLQTMISVLYSILAILYCIPLSPYPVIAQENATIISYEQYISVITQKLPQIKNNVLQVEKAYNQVEKAKSVDDTNLIAKGQYARQKMYTTGKSLYEPDYKQSYYGYMGIEQTLASTGTRVSLGLEYNASSITGNLTIPPQAYSVDEYRPSITATITQPLLKNAFGIIDRYVKNSAAMKLEIQKLQQLQDDQSVLNYYKKLYFNWVLYKQALDIWQESITNARSLVDSVKRKARAGLAENDDVQRAVSSLLNYQAQYKQYEIAYKSLCDELSLYFDTSITPDINDMNSMFDNVVSAEYTEVPFEKTRSWLIVKKNMDVMQYTINVADNSTLPQMNLILSASRKNYSDRQREALSKLPDTDYSVGVEFSYPLGNHDADAQLKDYELSLKELEHNLLITQNSYYKSLRTIMQYLNGYKELIATHNKNLQALISQRQTERKKYEQARLDLQYLINTENSVAMEKLTLLQLKVGLLGYYIDYKDLTE